MPGIPSQEQLSEKTLSEEQAEKIQAVMRSQGISMEELALWAIQNSASEYKAKLNAIKNSLMIVLPAHSEQKSNGGIGAGDIMANFGSVSKLELADKEFEIRQINSLGDYVSKINKLCFDFKDSKKGPLEDLSKAVKVYQVYAVLDAAMREATDRKEAASSFDLGTSEQNHSEFQVKEIQAQCQKIIDEKKAAIEKLKEENKSVVNSFPTILSHNLRKWVEYLDEGLIRAIPYKGFFAPSWVGYVTDKFKSLSEVGRAQLDTLDRESAEARDKNNQKVKEQNNQLAAASLAASRMQSRQVSIPSSRAGGDYRFSAAPSMTGRSATKDTRALQQVEKVLPTFFPLKTIQVLNELSRVLGVSTDKSPALMLPVATADRNAFFASKVPSSESILNETDRALIMEIMGDLIMEDGDEGKDLIAITNCVNKLGENVSQSTQAVKSLHQRLTQFQLSINKTALNNPQTLSCPGFLMEEDINALNVGEQKDKKKLDQHYDKVKLVLNLIGGKPTPYLPIYNNQSKLYVTMSGLCKVLKTKRDAVVPSEAGTNSLQNAGR